MLLKVEQRRRWCLVSEDMVLSKKTKTKLENLYVKYVLPFDTASICKYYHRTLLTNDARNKKPIVFKLLQFLFSISVETKINRM